MFRCRRVGSRPKSDAVDAVVSRYWLADLIGELPGRAREVVELRYLDGLEHDEIAARLGIERNNVDQALHRGHLRLREAIDV